MKPLDKDITMTLLETMNAYRAAGKTEFSFWDLRDVATLGCLSYRIDRRYKLTPRLLIDPQRCRVVRRWSVDEFAAALEKDLRAP